MEADLHSTPFGAMRYSGLSSKRPRSPDVGSNSSLDRPFKRPLLIVASEIGNMPSTIMSHGCYFAGGKSGNNSRYPSEDWVRQTDQLSIESPVIPGTNPFLQSEGKLPLQDSDDVNMDSEEERIAANHVQRLDIVSAQTSSSTPTHALMSPHPSEGPSNQSPSEQLIPTTMLLTRPTVNVLPPTPTPLSRPYFDPESPYPPTRPSSPVSNNSMMALSPSPLYVNLAASRRQQRFTMGPRADCEKCRLGIKGHWVHY